MDRRRFSWLTGALAIELLGGRDLRRARAEDISTPEATPDVEYRARYGYDEFVTREFRSFGLDLATPVNLYTAVVSFEREEDASRAVRPMIDEFVRGQREVYDLEMTPAPDALVEGIDDDEVFALQGEGTVIGRTRAVSDHVFGGYLMSRRKTLLRYHVVGVFQPEAVEFVVRLHQSVRGRVIGDIATPRLRHDRLRRDGIWHLLPTLSDVPVGMVPFGDHSY